MAFAFLKELAPGLYAWAAYCNGFSASYNEESLCSQTIVAMCTAKSKTDQRHLGKTSSWPFLAYLAIFPDCQGPLFVTADCKPVTKQCPSLPLSSFPPSLSPLSLLPSHLPSSSSSPCLRLLRSLFSHQAATTATACKLKEGLIKALGRWSSCAYQEFPGEHCTHPDESHSPSIQCPYIYPHA